MENLSMAGKKVLVTGSGTGIGRGVALEFARNGADVALHYSHSAGGAESAVAEIIKNDGKARAFKADFNDACQAKNLASEASDFLGGLDILVNNAGITMNQPFMDTTVEQFNTLFNVNIRAMFFCTQGAAEVMTKAGKGAIINISSGHAFAAITEHAVYASTKAAIVGFTRTLSLELIQKGVRVNCIASGWVLVENQLKVLGADFDKKAAGMALPSGLVGEAQDIANLAMFLASDASRYIIGQTILCDGGQSTIMACTPNFRTPMKEQWGQGYVPGR